MGVDYAVSPSSCARCMAPVCRRPLGETDRVATEKRPDRVRACGRVRQAPVRDLRGEFKHARGERGVHAGLRRSSVNRIAQEAGVSIKTLHRHFDSKDELFSAVIIGSCGNSVEPSAEPPWSERPPEVAFAMMDSKYLELVPAPNEIALTA